MNSGAIVELEPRVDGVKTDTMPELTQARDRTLAFGRGEVVEDAPCHQEVGCVRARLGLELGKRECRVEREIDVVAEQQISGRGLAVEEREPVPAGPGRVEELAIVLEVKGTAHVPPAVGTGTCACP